MGVSSSLHQPFATTEVGTEETGSLEVKNMHSSPQLDQASPMTGIQPFIYELEAN